MGNSPLFEPHEFDGTPGIIGGNCRVCHGPIVEPWHQKVRPISETVKPEEPQPEEEVRCGCYCCNCLDGVHCKTNDGISNCAVTDDPPGHCCERPGAAPGDRWICPTCGRGWTAQSAGPLDIRWRLDTESSR